MNIRTLPERKGKNWMRAATHCVNGHEFSPANTCWDADFGWRACKTCKRERTRRARQAQRASA
jgi:hypothetical protein